MKNQRSKDVFMIGFAIFAMFFGAGNLIFPPYLGLISGKSWFLSFLCFIITDIGFSILALIIITKIGKGAKGITEKLGKYPSALILSLNAICLGPLIAIPRTAATAFEFSVAPFFGDFNGKIFSVIFFAAVILFCLRQSKVIDIIGTFFAPVILGALIFLIIKGIVTPLGPVEISDRIQSSVQNGVTSGYQTMDVMAAMIFSASIILTARQKGYGDGRQQFKIVSASSLLAAFILFVVYGGLTYLGATVSGIYPPDIDRVDLLIAIVRSLLGKNGMVLLGILVCAACLTPAIGLLSSCASFFEKQVNQKVSYRAFVFLFGGISCVISNFGIEKILALASPVLNILYPVLVLLVFMALIKKWIPDRRTYQFAALGTIAASILCTLSQYTQLPVDVARLPLYQYGFQWLLPAIICGAVGFISVTKKPVFSSELFRNIIVRT